MENISYFYAASAYEAPEVLEFVPLQINIKFFSALNWQKLSSKTAIGFLTVALSLSVLSVAGQAMAAEKLGSKGAEVIAIQRCLKDQGYLKGKADGYFGSMTKKAVTSYQKANNLTADGIIGTNTAQKLKSDCSSSNSSSINSSTLRQGSRGSAVKILQDNLRKLGIYDKQSTSYYGPITKNAVIRFQKSQGLKADGIVGLNTQTKIQAALNNPKNPTKKFSSTTYSTLRVGSKGSQVTSLQQRLKELGYFKGNITKYFGPITKNAVINFQKSQGLKADGIVGPKTWNALQKNPIIDNSNTSIAGKSAKFPVLKKGSKGEDVKYLQQKLNLPTNGIFGTATRTAVIVFQQGNGLKADGIVGPKTWEKINSRRIVPDSSKIVLRRGDSGSKVRELQQRLNIKADGLFGSGTEAAAKKFQKSKGLPATGVVDSHTWDKLSKTLKTKTKMSSSTSPSCINRPTLSYGAKGEHVTYLQKRLRDWGYFSGNPTSYFGSGTEIGVKRFQQAKELYPDGIVSKGTWKALEGQCSTSTEKRYVVVVPLTIPEILDRARLFVPSANVDNLKLGRYVNAGEFKSYNEAKQVKQILRDNGLDARVKYM